MIQQFRRRRDPENPYTVRAMTPSTDFMYGANKDQHGRKGDVLVRLSNGAEFTLDLEVFNLAFESIN